MTFRQARAISKANRLHVRRAAWSPDKWFIIWRGTWFVYDSTGLLGVVRAIDYTRDDLLADDWTTVPAPLASCPITPTEPSGGGEPTPGAGGFADDPTTPPPAGGGGGGGGGGGSITLPTPDPGTSIKVVFAGLALGADPSSLFRGIDTLNGPYTLPKKSDGVWETKFQKGGFYPAETGTFDHPFEWTITVTRVPEGEGSFAYHVEMSAVAVPAGLAPSGGFRETVPEAKNAPMNNIWTTGDSNVGNGTATVH